MKLRTFILAAVFPLLAEAATITSGTITIIGDGVVQGDFNFSGLGFSASGFFETLSGWDLAAVLPVGTPPGGTVGVSGGASTEDFQIGGTATVGGMNFNNVNWGGLNSSSIFNIVGGPPITLNAGPGTYQTTFTFSGQLCGNAPLLPPPPCEFTLPNLTGAGIVTVNFEAFSNGNLAYTGATYTFGAVPEPATWLLVAIGAAAIFGLRRVKRA